MGDTNAVGLVALTLVLAVGVGWALGGRLRRLDRIGYRGLPLLAAAAAAAGLGVLAAAAGLPAAPAYGAGLALAGGLTLAFCVRSAAVAGTGLVGVGLLLNALAVVSNGGMPVSAAAAARAGVSWPAVIDDGRHLAAGPGTALAGLGDVIPVPLPGRPEVISAGDLLVAAGLGQLVATAMRPRRRTAPAAAGRATRTVAQAVPAAVRPATTAGGAHVRVLRPGDGGRPAGPAGGA